MRISENWLREWINPPVNIKILTEQMTMIGFKVNNIEKIDNCFCGIVIGKIIKCYQHPTIKTLKITKVDIGSDNLLKIICSASNCRAKIKVVVATINVFLTKHHCKLKSILINNESSDGMLCSLAELGLSKQNLNNSNIIELPLDAPVGNKINNYFDIHDKVIDFSITPNRTDCLSLIGISREIAVANNLLVKQPKIKDILPVIHNQMPVYIDSSKDCPSYLGRIIKNINANTFTPIWMKEKLFRVGISSINVIKDIINYVYFEFGQPMQTFDLHKIQSFIKIRFAYQNEVFNFKNKKIILKSNTLVISDQYKILAIAGISDSNIILTNSTTNDIFLECAFLNKDTVVKYDKCYNFSIDDFYRHKQIQNITLQRKVIEYATTLLVKICGGQPGPLSSVINDLLTKKKLTYITLRRNKLNQLVGYCIEDDKINSILNNLGCKILQKDNNWQILVPNWRIDLNNEEDLIEEIIRIYGYNKIPNKNLRLDLKIKVSNDISSNLLSRVRLLLVDKGYHEVITYSFINPKIQNLLHPQKTALLLMNPISEKMSTMRLSLWTGLLQTLIYNQNRQQKKISLFEIGLCFTVKNIQKNNINQNLILAGLSTGLLFDQNWFSKQRIIDFYDVKGDLESVFQYLNKLENISFKRKFNYALHPNQSAGIFLKKECIGYIGTLHPKLKDKLHLNGNVIIFQLLWEKINKKQILEVSHVSKFPMNYRDLTIEIPENVPVGDIISECKKLKESRLVNISVLDIYQQKNVIHGHKNVTIRFFLQDKHSTLTEKEISLIMTRYETKLKNF